MPNIDSMQYYRILARHSSKCLDVRGGENAVADGARVQQYAYFGTDNQKWRFVPSRGGYYQIVAKHSARCLDVLGGVGAKANVYHSRRT